MILMLAVAILVFRNYLQQVGSATSYQECISSNMIVTSSDLCWHMKVDRKKKSPPLTHMPIADDVFTH